MNILQAIILGIVQGITEWLPVSSSGHLVITQMLFQLESDIFFDVAVHFATLLVAVIVLRKEIWVLLRSLLLWETNSPQFRYIIYLVVATLPIAIVGYFFASVIESLFSQSLVVGCALMVTGLYLWITQFATPTKRTFWHYVVVGVAQVFALIPGISRSGITISSGLLVGFEREEAGRLSFLLFIPAVLGATIYQTWQLQSSPPLLPLAFGFISATFTGLVALPWLLKIINKGKLHYFAWYCWAVGFLLILAQSI